ncbi:hypothetical protein KIPB_015118, partial [Kipferlia bialata]
YTHSSEAWVKWLQIAGDEPLRTARCLRILVSLLSEETSSSLKRRRAGIRKLYNKAVCKALIKACPGVQLEARALLERVRGPWSVAGEVSMRVAVELGIGCCVACSLLAAVK